MSFIRQTGMGNRNELMAMEGSETIAIYSRTFLIGGSHFRPNVQHATSMPECPTYNRNPNPESSPADPSKPDPI